MFESVDEANRVITGVDRLPYGKAQIVAALALCEQVEASGPEGARAYALNTLVKAYCFGGEPEKAYVPFGRVVAWYDARPEMFDEIDKMSLFWSFKWMVRDLMDYPQVPWDQLESTLEDMSRRYAIAGLGQDAPAQARWQLAAHRGSPDLVELFEAWERNPRDDMSNCALCSAGDKIEYQLTMGRRDEGLRLLEATLADSTLRQECTEEPATMLSMAIMAYLERGAPDDLVAAVRTYRRARSFLPDGGEPGASSSGTIRRPTELVGVRARCIEFLARTRNVDAAVRLLEANQLLLTTAESPLSRLRFLRHVGVALHLLVDELDQGARPIAIIDGHLEGTPIITLADLWAWERPEAEALARAFDARNQTSYQLDLLRRDWQARPLDHQLDLRLIVPDEPETAEDAPALATPAPAAEPPASAFDAPADEPARTDEPAGPDQAVRLAERAVREGRRDEAVRLYLGAADQFEADGRLSEAGFARAEAGRLALLLDDLDTATVNLQRAWQVLRAADVPVSFVAPVSAALAQALAYAEQDDEAEAVLDQVATRLAAGLDTPASEAVAPDVAKTRADDLAWASVLVDEARAKVLVIRGEVVRCAELYQSVGERYAGLGLIAQAAGAFAQAGEAFAGREDERAIWCLESAVEGYKWCGRRAERARVAGTLMEILQRLGREAQAAEIAATL